MKIAHIVTTICRGGAEFQLLILAKEQIDQGNILTIFPLKGSLDLADDFRSAGVEVDLSLHNKRILMQIINAKRILKNSTFNVLHAHLPQAELLIAMVRHKNKFCSRHYGGKFFPRGNRYISRFLSRYATRNLKAVIAISDSVALMLRQSREVAQATRVVVARYGFSNSRFKNRNGKNLQACKEKNVEERTFSCFARLSPEKNLAFLLKAWSIVYKRSPRWNLKIFGTGPQRDQLIEECRQLGLKSEEILLGHTKNVDIEMAHSSAVIFPSKYEGFGMVLLEAMSVGVPIIASDIPVCHEVLGSDGAGIFFSLEQPEQLAETILNLDDFVDSIFKEKQAERLADFNIVFTAKKILEIYLS